MFQLAETLHRKYPQYLLSNTDPIHIPWCLDRFPLSSLLDGMILSYEIGAYKPDFRIYERGLEKFGLRPEECVFIDDLPANVEAAKACGLEGIVCISPEQVREDLCEARHHALGYRSARKHEGRGPLPAPGLAFSRVVQFW